MILRTLALAGLCAILLAGCSKPAAPAGELRIEKAWVRATPPGAQTAAAYLTIVGGPAPDRLVSVSSAAAQHVDAHMSAMKDGVMTMRAEDGGVAIAPGAAVAFEPGGRHLMFTGLKTAFVAGDTVPVVLTFEKAGAKSVEMPVLDAPPTD